MIPKLTKHALKDIIQWDIKNWSKCLNFWEENAELDSSKKVLALGEREGGISLYFALKGHEVICTDYNPMPETTKKMHERYGVSDLISNSQIDMKAIDLEDESVDIVVFKSVLGALGNEEDQKKALSEIYRVLKKDGTLCFAENLTGSAVHRYLRRKFVNWGERWRYITRTEMLKWGSNFKSHHTKSFGVVGLFGRSEKQRQFLGFIDLIKTPFTPKKWRYIIFGVFKK